MNIPQTSTTLLRDLASGSQHARWGEFVARYRPMMEAYMAECFPSIEAADVIQETFVSLIRVFPVYNYVPDEKGLFRNYLTGVLRHKALKIVARESKRASLREAYASEPSIAETEEERSYRSWRDTVFEIALRQYLADDAVNARTKQIFTRLAVDGERPEDVARAFGIERNAVDQIKCRAMTRLRELVKALEQVDNA